jgi:hypothetical protein
VLWLMCSRSAISWLVCPRATGMRTSSSRAVSASPSAYVLVSIGNALDESWTYYFALAVGLEVTVFALILRYAWTWPRTAMPATTSHHASYRHPA